ncbi:hypothetical protein EYF80_010609 [Liparis tanakae]|uniref:Uncharacterized protein n=1 Tax=Liparis tanakae TaxID=230148 RepID=A0A4Z2IMZ9_9TELE|nr:hypothetical protein EYF80_010609 [Liparis tanakae]
MQPLTCTASEQQSPDEVPYLKHCNVSQIFSLKSRRTFKNKRVHRSGIRIRFRIRDQDQVQDQGSGIRIRDQVQDQGSGIRIRIRFRIRIRDQDQGSGSGSGIRDQDQDQVQDQDQGNPLTRLLVPLLGSTALHTCCSSTHQEPSLEAASAAAAHYLVNEFFSRLSVGGGSKA